MKHVFCIGFNKTATTSLARLFGKKILCADQGQFEKLIYEYYNHNYDAIINEIHRYKRDTFFQDVPFSMPNLYKILDQNFPKAKFILSVRDSAEQWLASLRRFHNVNSIDELKNFDYNRENWLYDWYVRGLGCDKNDPLNEEYLKSVYSLHIKNANEYFQGSKNFIQVNIKEENLLDKLSNFIGANFLDCRVPHANKSV
jgi:hypothetical protein